MVIFTKLPIVKILIEIIILIQTYQNDMKMVLDRYTALAFIGLDSSLPTRYQ